MGTSGAKRASALEPPMSSSGDRGEGAYSPLPPCPLAPKPPTRESGGGRHSALAPANRRSRLIPARGAKSASAGRRASALARRLADTNADQHQLPLSGEGYRGSGGPGEGAVSPRQWPPERRRASSSSRSVRGSASQSPPWPVVPNTARSREFLETRRRQGEDRRSRQARFPPDSRDFLEAGCTGPKY